MHGGAGGCVCIVGASVAGGHAWKGGECVEVGMHGRGVCVAGRDAWKGACVAGQRATAADGTHPTGMDSCHISSHQ